MEGDSRVAWNGVVFPAEDETEEEGYQVDPSHAALGEVRLRFTVNTRGGVPTPAALVMSSRNVTVRRSQTL